MQNDKRRDGRWQAQGEIDINKSSPYDIVLVHENLSAMSDDEVFKLLAIIFPERGLYRISIDWRKDKQYILKAKGTMGDVIVGWIDNQYDRKQSTDRVNLRHCPIL